ncbi:hypothetical protein J7K74_02055 [Candidatus Woesearchaeota archaeon]|nr:hypothetical protein [Candidatus Woesearchaeota archaeon]
MAIEDIIRSHAKEVKDLGGEIEHFVEALEMEAFKRAITDFRKEFETYLGADVIDNYQDFYKALKEKNYLIDKPEFLEKFADKIYDLIMEQLTRIEHPFMKRLKAHLELKSTNPDEEKYDRAMAELLLAQTIGLSRENLRAIIKSQGIRSGLIRSLASQISDRVVKTGEEFVYNALYKGLSKNIEEIDAYLDKLHSDVGTKYKVDVFSKLKLKEPEKKIRALWDYHLGIEHLSDEEKRKTLPSLFKYIN